MKLRMIQRLESSEGGFALAAVIFVLALLGVLAVTSFITTGDERRASVGMRESARAFYAAEAGVNLVMARWDSVQYDTLIAGPGDSLDLGWETLPENGTSYWAVIQRIDNGGKRLLWLRVEGRGVSGLGARRVLNVSLLKTAPVVSSIVTSAVRGGSPGNRMRLRENEVLSGRDTIPPGWGPECTAPLQDTPGVTWGDTSEVRIDPPAGLDGVPLLQEDATITDANIFEFDGFNYDDLAAQADKVWESNVTLWGTDVFPVESPPGTCDVSVLTNFGAPEDPAHPCSAYFPIIHVKGTLWLQGVVGQGIILADDQTIFDGDTKWYGIVLTGRVRFRDNATVIGGLITEGDWDSRHFSTIRYSQCAVERALAGTSLGSSVQPLPGSWTEILH